MTEIYGVTGMPLSGKTSVAEIMERHGYTKVDMGNVVRDEMEKRDIDVSETGTFVNRMREEDGMDAIAGLTIPYLEDLESEKIVITGMRGWSEKQRFEEEMDSGIRVIAVWSGRETRRERMGERKREEDIQGQEFHERDIREIENGVGKLLALSDEIVVNDGSLQELETEVESVITSD
jgi:dephospho-CoA kinase